MTQLDFMHGSILGLTKDIFRGDYPSNLNPWVFSINSARLFVVLLWIIVSALFRSRRGVYFINLLAIIFPAL
jgi:hypothetical protein